MTPLQSRIMARLRVVREVQTAAELTDALGEPREAIDAALVALQDSSDVYLRNGFFRATPLHWSRFRAGGV